MTVSRDLSASCFLIVFILLTRLLAAQTEARRVPVELETGGFGRLCSASPVIHARRLP